MNFKYMTELTCRWGYPFLIKETGDCILFSVFCILSSFCFNGCSFAQRLKDVCAAIVAPRLRGDKLAPAKAGG